MTGLVHELQSDALDRSVNVSDLLRKALVVSSKLNITNIKQWIAFELNGYPFNDEQVPDYRTVNGIPHVKNPYSGWVPLNFRNHTEAEVLSKTKCTQAVSELEHLAATENAGHLRMDYPQLLTNLLMERMDRPSQPSLIVQKSLLIGILDSVRSQVLEWALFLEEQVIVGEGMSFSDREKEVANSITTHITNNIGTMNNSQLQQESSNATQSLTVNSDLSQITGFLECIKSQLEDMELNSSQRGEIQADVLTIETQLSSPKPKQLIVTESLRSIRAVLEGVTGSVIASGLLNQVSSLLQ